MQKRLLLLSPLLFFVLISGVHAKTTFNPIDLPTMLDNQLGIGTFVCGLIISILLELFVLLPTMYMTKGKAGAIYLVLFFSVAAPLVGLGWFPIWLYVILLLAIALGLGQKLSDCIGGSRR